MPLRNSNLSKIKVNRVTSFVETLRFIPTFSDPFVFTIPGNTFQTQQIFMPENKRLEEMYTGSTDGKDPGVNSTATKDLPFFCGDFGSTNCEDAWNNSTCLYQNVQHFCEEVFDDENATADFKSEKLLRPNEEFGAVVLQHSGHAAHWSNKCSHLSFPELPSRAKKGVRRDLYFRVRDANSSLNSQGDVKAHACDKNQTTRARNKGAIKSRCSTNTAPEKGATESAHYHPLAADDLKYLQIKYQTNLFKEMIPSFYSHKRDLKRPKALAGLTFYDYLKKKFKWPEKP